MDILLVIPAGGMYNGVALLRGEFETILTRADVSHGVPPETKLRKRGFFRRPGRLFARGFREEYSMERKSRMIAAGGMIAAIYIVLTLICSSIGLASGMIQFRFSEALCVLPFFTPAAVPGLFLGCLLSNLITGCPIWDIVFGTLATLLGAVGTRVMRQHRLLGCLPPILVNAVLIPPVLVYAYGIDQALWLLVLTVTAGEALSILVPGQLLFSVLKKRPELFRTD